MSEQHPISELETSRPKLDLRDVSFRLAETPEEIKGAQQLRYRVFADEYGWDKKKAEEKSDKDIYDEAADHLIVTQGAGDNEEIIGTYRLLRRDIAEKHHGFYTSGEFDLSALMNTDMKLLELGRSCVLEPFRTKPVLQLLWQGIADYVIDHKIDLLFGCACFPGTDIPAISEQLAYLHHYHATPEHLRPKALPSRYVNMDLMDANQIDPRKIFAKLPPLIKGYLRTGSCIGDGAVIDEEFKTTDVCITFETRLLTDRYKKHFERKTQKSFQ